MQTSTQLAARHLAAAALLAFIAGRSAIAADQTQPGAGNAAAVQLAQRSPLVQSSVRFLVAQAEHIRDRNLRGATLDILRNPKTCVVHRRGLAKIGRAHV